MPIKKSYLEQKWYYRVAKIFFLLLPLLIVLIFYILQKNIFTHATGLSLYYFYVLQKNIIIYIAIGLPLYYLILNVVWRIFFYIAFGGLENDTKKKDVVATKPVGPVIQPAPALAQTPTRPPESQNADNALGWFIFTVIIIIIIWALITSGFGDGGEICPKKTGQITCGYCAEDVVTSNNPNAGKCFYCPEGSSCVGDPCSGITCSRSGGTSGSKSGGTSGSKSGESKSGSKCVPTGCGSWWYCSGKIIVRGLPGAKDVRGCFPQPVDDMLSEMGYPAGAYWTGVCRQCP